MKSPAFSLYVRDALCGKTLAKLHSMSRSKDASNLLSRAVNAYWFLLCNSWLQEPRATLPKDDGELADLAKVSMEEWLAMKHVILSAFSGTTGERIFHPRLMQESDKQQKKASAGSKGGSTKQLNLLAEDVAPLADAIATEDAAASSTRSLAEAALTIYEYYPRKIARPSAIKAIEKALKNTPFDKVLGATRDYAVAVSHWPEDEKKFIPYGQRWYNESRFLDDPASWCRKPKNQSYPPLDHSGGFGG